MDQLTKIQKRLEPELAEMNAIISGTLDTPNELMNRVVTNYLKTKGKQIRPIMVILSAGLFGNINKDVLYAGAALEMLHNASLIHDDVVDETSLRRGKITVNWEWGNHIAVLVGDFFVSNALAAGIKTGNIEIISSLSELGKELSLGEVVQICNVRDHRFDETHYFDMINKKTASLFMNCAKMGAEAAGVLPEEYKPLVEYARLLGLCFQIRDDIFDYFDNKLIGKPTGNDLREGKVTLPLIYALNNATKKEADEMRLLIVEGNPDDSKISCLVDFAINKGGIDYAYSTMRDIESKATPLLNNYPDSTWKESFRDLFSYIIERDH